MNKNFKNKQTNLSTKVDFSAERRIDTTKDVFTSFQPKHVSTGNINNNQEKSYIVIYRVKGVTDCIVGKQSQIQSLIETLIDEYKLEANSIQIFELKSDKPIALKVKTITSISFE